MKLVQKHFLKGTREFVLEGDIVTARIKRVFREEKLTVGVSTLNPEPVVKKPFLEFYSRVNSEPVLSLFLDNPDAMQFGRFVDMLRRCAYEAHSTDVVPDGSFQTTGLAANAYEEPPEFEESGYHRTKGKGKTVNARRVGETIQLLKKFMDEEEIKPLLAALEALKSDPQNDSYFDQMLDAFNNLGVMQGAVLTYAPYMGILVADSPFIED